MNAKQSYKTLLCKALVGGLAKFNPRTLYQNPVIFLTELSALTLTFYTFIPLSHFSPFSLSVTLWLWFTVYFATFSESIAEIRNKAQAAALQRERQETTAHIVTEEGEIATISAHQLRPGDRVFVYEGEHIPADGEIVVGKALLDESSFTGESEPVIRSAGTEHNSVMAGTKVLSDEILMRVMASPGHSFLDRVIGLIQEAKRKKTPNELALSHLLVGLTAIFVVIIFTFQLFGAYYDLRFPLPSQIALLICLIPTTIGGLLSAVGIAGIHRLLKKNVLAMSGQAIEAAGDVNVMLFDKTGTITTGDRNAVELIRNPEESERAFIEAALFTSLQDATTEGSSIVALIRKTAPLYDKPLPEGATSIPFTAETRLSGVDIAGQEIRKGALDAMEAFAQKALPFPLKARYEVIARSGGTPLIVGTRGKILGMIHLKDTIKEGLKERFSTFRALGIKTIMMTGDDALTAKSVCDEVGLDSYLAGVTPEAKLKELKAQQHKGLIVGMTGDGVNDAPALAHADVAMAMNAGTQTAKEAANMIDLDSLPTKLFDVIEVGKQMLMTRGALTTFSIANDFSKYFVILPAILAPYFPSFESYNVMRLSSAQNAILSALIFNALIIIALLPLAFKGVKLVKRPPLEVLNKNLLLYGLGGVAIPFFGIKLIDLVLGIL